MTFGFHCFAIHTFAPGSPGIALSTLGLEVEPNHYRLLLPILTSGVTDIGIKILRLAFEVT